MFFCLQRNCKQLQIIWMNFTCFLFQKKTTEFPLHNSRVNVRGLFGYFGRSEETTTSSSLSRLKFSGDFLVRMKIKRLAINRMVPKSLHLEPETTIVLTVVCLIPKLYIHTKWLVGNHQTSIHLKNCLACRFIPDVSPQDATGDSEPPQEPHRICFFVSHDGRKHPQ